MFWSASCHGHPTLEIWGDRHVRLSPCRMCDRPAWHVQGRSLRQHASTHPVSSPQRRLSITPRITLPQIHSLHNTNSHASVIPPAPRPTKSHRANCGEISLSLRVDPCCQPNRTIPQPTPTNSFNQAVSHTPECDKSSQIPANRSLNASQLNFAAG
jgi:hypothetical protein